MNPLTVEALAEEIARLDSIKLMAGDSLTSDELARDLLPFIERHIAAGEHEDALVLRALVAAGHVDQSKVDHAREIMRPLATPQPPKPAGAVPLPEPTDDEIDALTDHLYRHLRGTGEHNGGMVGVAWNRALFRNAFQLAASECDAREAAGRADAVPASEGVDEDREMAVQMLALSRKPRRVQAAPQQMTTQCEGISKPISWQRQALLLMDEVDRLVRHCAVCADTFEFYKPCADAFWKVCRMIAESETDISDPVVKATAAKCGVYYGKGKVDLGAPLYAFTPTELIAFARNLTGAAHG